MFKKILFIGLFLSAVGAKAHSTNVSTTMLVEKENGSWVLQVSASLTAFQHEVRTHFAETPYKTPEEFQIMVMQHLKNNLEIIFNDTHVNYGKGAVQLGHETRVVFEVFGIPDEIKSARIKNTAFKDIHRNKSALIILKEGFTKEHFDLSHANNHELKLKVSDNQFVAISEIKAGIFNTSLEIYIGLAIIMLLAVFGIFNLFKPEKMVVNKYK